MSLTAATALIPSFGTTRFGGGLLLGSATSGLPLR